MPISLGKYEKYLVPGLSTLPEKDLEQLSNAHVLVNTEPHDLERTVDQLTMRWTLSEKVDVIVRGIKSEELTREEMREKWGRMLLYFYYGNIGEGTDPMGSLGPPNNALIKDIEEDYVQPKIVLSGLGHELSYSQENLEMILQYPGIRSLYKEFTAMEGLMWFVERGNVEEFRRTTTRLIEYQNRLFELVQAGIKEIPETQSISVDLNWDRYGNDEERGLDDTVTNFEVLPEEVERLNPLEQTALVISTLRTRSKRENFSIAGYLQILTEALYIYQEFDPIAGGFPQREGPLGLLQKDIPNLIRESDYIQTSTGLEQIYGQPISEDELPQILENIRNNPDVSETLQKFHTKDGLDSFIYVGNEQTNKDIGDVVWSSVPRFIEEEGYILLKSLINDAIPEKLEDEEKQKLYASIVSDETLNDHVEVFENTTQGTLVYVVPDEQEFVNNYLKQFVHCQHK